MADKELHKRAHRQRKTNRQNRIAKTNKNRTKTEWIKQLKEKYGEPKPAQPDPNAQSEHVKLENPAENTNEQTGQNTNNQTNESRRPNVDDEIDINDNENRQQTTERQHLDTNKDTRVDKTEESGKIGKQSEMKGKLIMNVKKAIKRMISDNRQQN